MTIGITGATGQLGRIVVEKLKQRIPGSAIVALVRNPEKAESLGVALRIADYARPETLADALAGLDTLLLISSSEVGQRASQHANVIAAAKQAGVGRIVYTSLLHADTSPLSLADEHRETEAALKASGVPFTVLRNGWYSENYLDSLSVALQHGQFIGSAGEGRIASATRADFAEAAAVVLTTTGHINATYELAGDSAWTLADLAEEVSRQAGQKVTYADLPEAEYAAVLLQAGLPEGLAAAIASWDVCASKGALYSDDKTLSRLIGRPTTPLSAAVSDALKAS